MAPPLPAFRKMSVEQRRDNNIQIKTADKVDYCKLLNEKILEYQKAEAVKAKYERMLEDKIQEAQREKNFQNSKISLLEMDLSVHPKIYFKPVEDFEAAKNKQISPVEAENYTENKYSLKETDLNCTKQNKKEKEELYNLKQILQEKEEIIGTLIKSQQHLQDCPPFTEVEQLQTKLQEKTQIIQEEKHKVLQIQEKLIEQEKLNKQLLNKITKKEEIIKTKQNEIQNKTNKIKNLQQEITKYQQQKINKKEICNKETMTRYRYKTKGIQTNFSTQNVIVQTEIEPEKISEILPLGETAEQTTKQQGEKNEIETLKEEIRKQIITETTKLEEKLQQLQNIFADTTAKTSFSPGEYKYTVYEDAVEDEMAEAAIVLRFKDYKTAIKTREILNTGITDKQTLPNFYSKLTRNRKIIVIKSQTEEQLKEILQKIQKNEYIKQAAEINYKQQNTQKLIITGIPKSTQPEKLINSLTSNYNSTTLKPEKIKQKDSSFYYQMVITATAKTAKTLLDRGFIPIGSRNCKITQYRPIVRCACCQLYGHSSVNCRRQPICAFCSMGHLTTICPNKNFQHLQNCTNCLYNENYLPHTADSPNCPLFKNLLQIRNNLATKSVNYDSSLSSMQMQNMLCSVNGEPT